jgi:hypothetical protein
MRVNTERGSCLDRSVPSCSDSCRLSGRLDMGEEEDGLLHVKLDRLAGLPDLASLTLPVMGSRHECRTTAVRRCGEARKPSQPVDFDPCAREE